MQYEGVRRLRIDKTGDLLLETKEGTLRHRKPLVYQDRGGGRELLNGRFVLLGKREVGFKVADYDRRVPLTIDPVLVYSTYLGGSNIDAAFDVAVDSGGNPYITGETDSVDFPTQQPIYNYDGGQTCEFLYFGTTVGPKILYPACLDMFVTKVNATGTELIYSTFIGGSLNDLVPLS
jgi:hypothetical protein